MESTLSFFAFWQHLPSADSSATRPAHRPRFHGSGAGGPAGLGMRAPLKARHVQLEAPRRGGGAKGPAMLRGIRSSPDIPYNPHRGFEISLEDRPPSERLLHAARPSRTSTAFNFLLLGGEDSPDASGNHTSSVPIYFSPRPHFPPSPNIKSHRRGTSAASRDRTGAAPAHRTDLTPESRPDPAVRSHRACGSSYPQLPRLCSVPSEEMRTSIRGSRLLNVLRCSFYY